MNYFRQNQDEMQRVIQTEVDVSLEKDGYILTGKVDLLLGGDGKLELLDFKTSPRPTDSPALLDAYERQLCTYAHILERRYGKRVDRLLLYWTAEERKDKALMAFPYRPERIDEAGRYFDQVVATDTGRGVPGDAAARSGDLQRVRPAWPLCDGGDTTMKGPQYLSRGIDHLGDLSAKLRDLQGFSTLAYELIQNADDVPKATSMTFNVCDNSLVVDNDGIFSDCQRIEEDECPWKTDPAREHRCDFHRFRHIASGDKRGEAGTTGAFGIGFIAVYQITDVPDPTPLQWV